MMINCFDNFVVLLIDEYPVALFEGEVIVATVLDKTFVDFLTS